MKCPKCGGRTKVIDTRYPSADETLRRRDCVVCEYIFFTIEYEINDDPRFRKCWKKCSRKSKSRI